MLRIALFMFLASAATSVAAQPATATGTATVTPLDVATQITQAITQHDDKALAALLAGATVKKHGAKKGTKLTTVAAAAKFLGSGGGFETKGGEACTADCCTWSDNGGNGWGDVPAHPIKACFAHGKLVSLTIVPGSE